VEASDGPWLPDPLPWLTNTGLLTERCLLAVGQLASVQQKVGMKNVKTRMDWLIMCALWILATTAGVTVGFNIARFMSFGGEGGPIVFWGLLTAGSLGGGAIIGLLQWLVLHRWFKNVGWWIAGTAVGFVLLYSCWLMGLPPQFYRILLAREVFPFVLGGG